jgi:hypothetical protein
LEQLKRLEGGGRELLRWIEAACIRRVGRGRAGRRRRWCRLDGTFFAGSQNHWTGSYLEGFLVLFAIVGIDDL